MGARVRNCRNLDEEAFCRRLPFAVVARLLAAAALLLVFLSGCTVFRNQPPMPGVSVSPAGGRAPLVVTFDGSPSYDPDGIIVGFTWRLADGQMLTGESLEHTFGDPGRHTITLTVTDDHGETAQTIVTVDVAPPNTPPVPRISVSPNPAEVGQDIEFSAATSTDDREIVWVRWSFGDGESGDGMTVSHRYAAPGTYTVMLSTTDDDGASSTATTAVSVQGADGDGFEGSDPSIDAQISASSSSISAGGSVTFDGTSSTSTFGGITRYVWSFGDGETAEGAVVMHRYPTAGHYIARLIVSDASGSHASRELEITVAQSMDSGEDPSIDWDGESFVTSYDWWYGGRRQTVSISIPGALIEEYSSRSRSFSVYGSYDQYVLDPLDDPLMTELATSLSAAVPGANYYDIAENALSFVQTIVSYARDPSGIEYPRYPIETLVEQIGDCEDSSILYASLLRTLGQGALIAGVDTSGSGFADHMVVFVPVGDDFADRVSGQGPGSSGLWQIEGRVYALAETAVDGSPLPLGIDPWGLDEGDIHQVWDVARVMMSPRVKRYEPRSSEPLSTAVD